MSEPALSAAFYLGILVLLVGLAALAVGPRRLRLPGYRLSAADRHRRARAVLCRAPLALDRLRMALAAIPGRFPPDPLAAPFLEVWPAEPRWYGFSGECEWLDLAVPRWQFRE